MVGTMIMMAYAGVQTVGALTAMQMAAAFAINFAVSQIVTRVFSQDQQGQQDNGVRQQVPPSSTNAIPVAYGDAYMGGTFVDAVLTTDQQTMYYVFAVSSISPNGQFTYDLSKFYYGDRLVTFAASGSVLSAQVFNGGSGYVVGDVLTVSGGTPTTATQLTVTQVSSGVITAVSISTAGSYAYGTTPNNPASVTGGSGTGAKFVLRFSAYGPTVQALCDEAGNIDTKYNDHVSLQISLFTSDQSGTVTKINTTDYPWDIMGGSDISAELRWPSTNRRMNGLAFAIARLAYNVDAGTTSLSPITFHVSHYLNGTGCAKPGDVWYDYITNKVYGGAVGWLPDGSFSTAFVDSASATTLNTYSDELITFNNSSGVPSTQPRYRMNGVLDAGQTVLTNIDKIMACCDSWMTYNAALGKWSVVVNKPETAAYSFDDDNIIGDIRVSATDITSSINQVEAKFPFKENRDQPSFVQLATPDNLLYPNEPVNKYSITYDLVNESVQASYLANRLLEQAREDLIVSFSTTYYGIQVDAGAVVSVTNSAYGWTDKLFRVMKVNEASLPDGSLGAKLELNEYNATVYDDYDVTAFSPAPNSNLPSVNYFSALSAPTITTSNPSSPIPNFNVTIAIPSVGRVTRSILYYTTSATPTASDWELLATASTIDGNAVTPGTNYVYKNLVLPTGASTTATYYFSYVVGNDIAKSISSPISASFTWTPSANVGPTGPTGSSTTGPTGPTGTSGNKVATVFLYQWASTTPGNPSGTSTYTWSPPGNASYTGGNGWQVSVPSNPGTPLLKLWVASKEITALASATVTTVSWSSGFSIYDAGQNGAAGIQSATPTVYQWAATIPTISGTSTYTWSTGSFTPTPSGWSTAPGTSTPGFTLWAAKVNLTDAATAITSPINWTTASILASGYAGGDGLSSRLCYARVPSNPAPVGGNIVTTGSSSYPTSSQSLSTWGFSATWVASDPNPSSTDSLYQSDGIYNPSTNQTTWGTPYISSLKVGSLSAITVNTGALTVQDTLTVSTTGSIKGGQTAYNTGTGFFLGYSSTTYKFSIGSSLVGMTWDGSAFSVNGGSITGSVIQTATSGQRVTINESSNNEINFYGNRGDGVVELLAAIGVNSSGSDSYVINGGTANSQLIGGYFQSKNRHGVVSSIFKDTASPDSTTAYGFSANGSGTYTGGLYGYASGGTNNTGVLGWSGGSSGANQFSRGVYGISTNGTGVFGDGAVYDFYAGGSGSNYGPFTGSHDGLVNNSETVEIGDIVVDAQVLYKYNISSCIFLNEKSSQPNQQGVIGVVSLIKPVTLESLPAALIEDYVVETNQIIPVPGAAEIIQNRYRIIINAVGEGQISVCGENGNIAVGDLIVSSSTAGKGMKQSDDIIHSYTVARARQAVTFSSSSEVQLVACVYISG